jgi:hypothetical protein
MVLAGWVLRPVRYYILQKHGPRSLIEGIDAVLPKRTLQFICADVLLRHVRFNGLTVVNHESRLASDQATKTMMRAREFGAND